MTDSRFMQRGTLKGSHGGKVDHLQRMSTLGSVKIKILLKEGKKKE